jgi:hypothetical protein
MLTGIFGWLNFVGEVRESMLADSKRGKRR